MALGSIIGGGLSLLGNIIGGNAQEDAARAAGDASVQAAQIQADLARELSTEFAFPFERLRLGGLAGARFRPRDRRLDINLAGNILSDISQVNRLGSALAVPTRNAFTRGIGLNPAQQAEIDRQRAGLEANLFSRGRLGLATQQGTVGREAVQPELASFQEGVTRGLIQEERAGQSHLLNSYLTALSQEMDLRETPLRVLAGLPRGAAPAAPAVDARSEAAGLLAAGQSNANAMRGLFSFLGQQIGSSFQFGAGNFAFPGSQGFQGVNRFGEAALLTGEPIPF